MLTAHADNCNIIPLSRIIDFFGHSACLFAAGLARPHIPIFNFFSLHRFRIFQRRRFFPPFTFLSSHVRLIPNLGSSTSTFYPSASSSPSLHLAESLGTSTTLHLIRSIFQKVSFFALISFVTLIFDLLCLFLSAFWHRRDGTSCMGCMG